jgi:hypothetical protein
MSFNTDPPRYVGTSATAIASHGSRTQIITSTSSNNSADEDESEDTGVVGVLRLRADEGRRVKWVNGVVDNEGLGRKKSKSEFLVSWRWLVVLARWTKRLQLRLLQRLTDLLVNPFSLLHLS